jgi:hypothetical protein
MLDDANISKIEINNFDRVEFFLFVSFTAPKHFRLLPKGLQ